MAVFVAFYRAINVGGNNKVGMAALKSMHEELGLGQVVTYLQTGNVLFESTATDSLQLTQQLSATFEKEFGFHSEVIVRTLAELEVVATNNPFQNQPDKDPKWQLIMLLTASPTEEARQALLSSYGGPEEIFPTDQALYIYYTEGVGRSKLTNVLIEKKLKVLGTGRNWNTITKLLELARSTNPITSTFTA
jgi:uncharacterized protein (DUF1697 family)